MTEPYNATEIVARQGGECRANVQDLAAKPSELLRAPWEATSEWPLGSLGGFRMFWGGQG